MDTHNEHAGDAQDHGDDHDHGGNGKYIVVFIALCVLTSASFLTFFPIWHDNVPTVVSRTFMMAVSCTKALLVMAFFMHLIWEANWKYVLTIPAGMMSIFLMLMLIPDVGCRYETYTFDRLIHAADPDTGPHPHTPGVDHGGHDNDQSHEGEAHDAHGH